jgi:hypothetical protein
VQAWLERQAARPWSAQLLPAALAVATAIWGVVRIDDSPGFAVVLLALSALNAAQVVGVALVKRRTRSE